MSSPSSAVGDETRKSAPDDDDVRIMGHVTCLAMVPLAEGEGLGGRGAFPRASFGAFGDLRAFRLRPRPPSARE